MTQCRMAATSPGVVTPEILCIPNMYMIHVTHACVDPGDVRSIRKLVSDHPAVLERCSKVSWLLQSLKWPAEGCVTIANLPGNLFPCAPMPIPDTDDTSLMHPALVTELTKSKPYGWED